jgi:hypothetical protein
MLTASCESGRAIQHSSFNIQHSGFRQVEKFAPWGAPPRDFDEVAEKTLEWAA